MVVKIRDGEERREKERVADTPFHNQLLQVVLIMMFLEMAEY